MIYGDGGTRTLDLCVANAPLSQLSYAPVFGVARLELAASWSQTKCPTNWATPRKVSPHERSCGDVSVSG